MEKVPARVLVVFAHPDDAEFGCSGTVARWAAQGAEVVYVMCTNGDKGSEDPTLTSPELARIREAEEREACRILGVKELVCLGFPDGGLEDTHEFRREVVRCVRQFQPETVITSSPYRNGIWHRDHRMAGRVTLDAVYPYARDRLIYPEHERQGLKPWKVGEVLLFASDEPDHFVDVTESYSTKVQSLLAHKSQMGERPEETIAKWVRERCEENGKKLRVPLAESFKRLEIRR
ncbi:MAG: PIG-L family deacetylase [Dehalococcoidia bacterium]|nr:PIG-L family deacetylase [Dehalococcoidia bacterium]